MKAKYLTMGVIPDPDVARIRTEIAGLKASLPLNASAMLELSPMIYAGAVAVSSQIAQLDSTDVCQAYSGFRAEISRYAILEVVDTGVHNKSDVQSAKAKFASLENLYGGVDGLLRLLQEYEASIDTDALFEFYTTFRVILANAEQGGSGTFLYLGG